MAGTIDLSDIDEDGFVVITSSQRPIAFNSVSDAGDVNGDGFADIIVGVQEDEVGGAGAAYVVYGRAGDFGTIDLETLTAAQGFQIIGDQVGDGTGMSVSTAGDVNGDGFADVIVGARDADIGYADSGTAYVVFGGATPHGAIDTSALSATQGFTLRGAAVGDQFGFSVSSAGDVNGDGIDDMIFGAVGSVAGGGQQAGAAYVIYGQSGNFGTIDLANLPSAVGFAIIGDAAGDYAGRSVSSAGDINGDGFDDMIVGAPFADGAGVTAGNAYVLFGGPATHGTIDLTTLAPTQGFVIQGPGAGNGAGFSASDAGDVNGDGIDDLIISVLGNSNGGTIAGGAYVVYGKTGTFPGLIDLATLTPAQGFFIQGDRVGDYAGFSVSGAGDFDGDGIDDLLVAAPLTIVEGLRSGRGYIVYGRSGLRSDLNLSDFTAGDGIVLIGGRAGGIAGASISSAGDVNGDGFDDLIIGAPGTSPVAPDPGVRAEAYVVYGRARGSLDFVGTARDDALFGAEGDDTIAGLDGKDAILGAAGNDALRGGAGNDRLDGGADDDDLFGGSGDDTLLGRTGDDAIVGGSGRDTIDAGDGDDTLAGGSGDDLLAGGAGTDRLDGGSGNDRLDGGTGGDIMAGGSGDDTYVVASVADRITEDADAGIDSVESAITFSLDGTGLENLRLTERAAIDATGNEAGNTLTGNGAANTIRGLGGDDRITGGAGKDVLTGGTGADFFRFFTGDTAALATGADTISDFNRAQGDRIDLTRLDAITGTPATDAFTFIGTAAFSGTAGELRYRVVGGDTLVTGDVDGNATADFTIRLSGSVALVGTDFVGGIAAAVQAGGSSARLADFFHPDHDVWLA